MNEARRTREDAADEIVVERVFEGQPGSFWPSTSAS
jgi:hypothetical protein